MTRAEVAALFDRREAAWRACDAAALAATHTPDSVVISPTGGVLEGRDEIERVYRVWLNAFKGITFVPDDLLIDGDRVVQIARLQGTHTGEFFGVAATGRPIEVTVALLITLADGFVAEERRIYDFTGLLVQTGVLRAKPGA